MYFPLIVDEALMIEPTETETRETLDYFIDVMKEIAREAAESPDLLHEAPHDTPNSRLDEARAARRPDLRWKPGVARGTAGVGLGQLEARERIVFSRNAGTAAGPTRCLAVRRKVEEARRSYYDE